MRAIMTLLCIFLLFPASVLSSGNTTVETLAKTTQSWDGQSLPTYPHGQPEITILRITIPPHTALPTHMHPVINAGVLIRGELTVRTQTNQTLHLKAGQAIIEVVTTWHHGVNEGDGDAEIIVWYAGTPGVPITQVNATTPPPSSPADKG